MTELNLNLRKMDRAERRRADRMKAGEGLAVGVDALTTPNHWHVDAVAYSHERDGVFMDAIHLHNLVTNDLVLCETYVLRTVQPLAGAKRTHVAIEQGTVCPDPTTCKAVQEADLIDREEG